MKKILISVLTAIFALVAMIASAESIAAIRYTSLTVGGVTITNDAPYQVRSLGTLRISGIQPADATGTVARISTVRQWGGTNSVVLTNTIGTVVCASNAGVSSNLNAVVYNGDKLVLSGIGTNAGTVAIEFTAAP